MADGSQVRLELTWHGKDQFLLSPKDDSGKPIWVERDHPAASEVRLTDFTGSLGDVDDSTPCADNLLFTGDSLDMLRVLAETPEFRREYRGKVKLVYIDPPFNTGQTFAHYDDFMEHSTWLSFMRDRLLLIKELLAPDGSVWVHLDDAEQHRMRVLMDEIFGAQNFVATVVWQKVFSPKNSARHLSVDQDYVLLYAKDAETWRPNGLPRTSEMDAAYTNPDSDPRGPWTSGDLVANKSYSLGIYPVTTPSGRVIAGPPAGRYWRVSHAKLLELDADNRVWWGANGDGVPRLKRFLTDVRDRVPQTMWMHSEVGHSQEAKKEIVKLFSDRAAFATPKPERLLQRVTFIGSNPGDIVLDCFGGSGTTAAVAHKMGRRWVTSEILPETVKAFTKPRLEMVVKGEDQGGISKAVDWAGGGGFRDVTIAPSMYEITDFGVLLSDWATDGRFARAVAGQLGFEWQPDAQPFCGVRGRMRLAVFDGSVGTEEIRLVVAALNDKERVTVVAKSVLPEAEELLLELSKGSRVRKAPRDLLTSGARRARRSTEGV